MASRAALRSAMVMTAMIGWAGSAGADGIAGTYTVDGKNPDGSAYSGTATIAGTEGGVCGISWSTGSNQQSEAFCMRQGDVVSAAYNLDGSIGLVIYRINSDGSLAGTWSIAGQEGVGEEQLTPQ